MNKLHADRFREYGIRLKKLNTLLKLHGVGASVCYSDKNPNFPFCMIEHREISTQRNGSPSVTTMAVSIEALEEAAGQIMGFATGGYVG